MGTARNAQARVSQHRHIAPIIREAIIEAVKNLKMSGKPLSKLIEQSFIDNPVSTLKAVSHYIPKELKIDSNVNVKFEGLSATMELLESIKSELARQQLPEPVPDRPLLPAAVRDDEEGPGEGVVVSEVQGGSG